ncbi:MAG TPA: TolC family protein [Bryobacteraceae bacterium]|nr:TolC family protein [Bryobacteraceae bacterium]
MERLVRFFVMGTLAAGLHAELHTLNLRQAVDRALEQNPDIALARLDEQKAAQAVRLAKAPFSPAIFVGSGIAYANGFPMSIEGSAPSIVQARAQQYIFNRQQSYNVAAARENARGAGIGATAKRDEVAFRTASLFLDAQRSGRLVELARHQVESLQKIETAVEERVKEGRELPLQSKRAALNLARARERVEQLGSEQDATERSLAVVLGFGADDQVRATLDEPPELALPASEDAAIQSAIESSKELRRLESALIAKGLDVRAEKAARLPTVDLIAQWALFAKYNHYADYFRAFQSNNGEIGLSITVPVLPGPRVSASVAQAELDAARLHIELNAARNRISLETRQSYQTLRKAETARDVARLDLEVARDEVSVLLAQRNEGRASLQQLEQLRFNEDEKWIAFYDAQYAAEKAAWDLLRQTGNVMAALR